VRVKSEREVVFDFLETVIVSKEEQFQDLLGVSAELGRAKQEFENRLEILAVLIADLLYMRESVAERIVNIDLKDRLEKLAGRVTAERLLKMADFLRFIESSLKTHVNRQMLTDVLAITANETTAALL
jgi:DNA polymerase III gamma/tau subunit